MNSFRFLHAADVHLDSPLHGLSHYEGLPVEAIRGATRAAFDNLIQYAIDEAVEFVVIAGDLFDGDWKDMGTGLHFAGAMGKLDAAGIPAFVLAGNHDAASAVTRSIPWPPNVRRFDSRRAQTHRLDELGVAVHGQSFLVPAITDNLVPAYPDADPHMFNIGVLHTALTGRQGHHDYAPCSAEDLLAKGYDYWALGHVHEFEICHSDPHIVFPGNIQGRTIRETGPKGAVLVTVADREVTSVERIELDVLRWTHLAIDCAGVGLADLDQRVRSALSGLHAENDSGRPLVVRISFEGETEDAGAFHDRIAGLRDDVRAIAASISADLHVEKVRALVHEPVRPERAALGDDFTGLIAEATTDAELMDALAGDRDLARFLQVSQALLGPAEVEDLRRPADQGDWAEILRTAVPALRARLIGEV